MWIVYDNNLPCSVKFHQVHASWKCSCYETLEEAVDYAANWFYPYLSDMSFRDIVVRLCTDSGYDYTGYGDVAIIRYIEDNE